MVSVAVILVANGANDVSCLASNGVNGANADFLASHGPLFNVSTCRLVALASFGY